MQRHPLNSNLRLHFEPSYHGMPVQVTRGPLVLEYLDLLNLTLQRALHEHRRTFAFRVDVRLPEGLDCSLYLSSNAVIERFIESFKAKIEHNRCKALRNYGGVHDTTVRYVWAREIGRCGKPHYHLVFFVNQDAYGWLGEYKAGRDNMFNRLQQAWASALGITDSAAAGLVELPNHPCYYLRPDDPAGIAAFFNRASYLCKAATKFYGNGCHAFGASRR